MSSGSDLASTSGPVSSKLVCASVIAAHGVNIADYALGRDRESGQAMNAIHIDNPLSEAALKEIMQVEGVRWARLVHMPS